jgi:hypothetical protein
VEAQSGELSQEMSDKYEPAKEEIKAAARVIARAMNRDPDGPSEAGPDHPYWHSYSQVARDALIAAEKVRQQES